MLQGEYKMDFEKITVKTQSACYPVIIGEALDFGKLTLDVKKPCRAVIVSDDNVFPLYGDKTIKSFTENGYDVSGYIIENGEASKNLDLVSRILRFLVDRGMTRQDILIALGGGIVGDIAGFVAAVYLRGIDFIQLPTTVLAAVDSSVGGKTGVNLESGKNLVGAFHQPLAVFCDTGMFATLPKAVRSCGMAEAVKHAMIADGDMLLKLGELSDVMICKRNIAIKSGIVEKDEFDTGTRGILNFGHTVGHAVETLSRNRIPHGNAVAIGMTVITRASEKSGLTEEPCLGVLTDTLTSLGLPVSCEYSAEEIAGAAVHDKKRLGDAITLAIPKRIGKAQLYRLPVQDLQKFISTGLQE